MRLLFLLRDTYPPTRPDVDVLFGRYLPSLEISSFLVSQRESPGPAIENAEWGGGEASVCRRYPRAPARNLLVDLIHDLAALASRSNRYDAIQVRDKILVAGIGLLVARLRGLPFIYWMSFPFPEAYLALVKTRRRTLGPLRSGFNLLRGQLGYTLLYRIVLPHADHVFVQSERMRAELVRRGVLADRMTAVPMGVELERACEALGAPRDSQPRTAGRRVVAYLGALERQRQADFLLKVVSRLRARYPTILLLVIGDSSEPGDREWLRERAVALGVDDLIEWCGWLPRAQAWQRLRSAEVGLSPIPPGFLFDVSSPTKVIEYLALGLPVIANPIPDQAQVIAESRAGLCVEYTPEAFAAGLDRLFSDSQIRKAMGAAGPPYVAKHRSYAVLARGVAERYHVLMGRESGSARIGPASIPSGGTS